MALHRQTHRLSTCHHHPTKPITGFCAPCLSECLSGLDSAVAHPQSATRNPHSGSELRRSKSCSGQRPESSLANAPDPTRRKSCDVRARNTLSELFNIDDDRKGLPRKFEVELRGEEERDDSGDEARVLDSDAEFKTMKELIDLKWERKKGVGRDLKEIAGGNRVLGSLRGGSHGGIGLGWEGVNGMGVKKTEGREVDWSRVKGFDLFSRALQNFDVVRGFDLLRFFRILLFCVEKP